MQRTLFHRKGNVIYQRDTCDQASVPVVDAVTGNPAGYIGCQWGAHPSPVDCVHWAICSPDDEGEYAPEADLLASWGLRRADL